MGRTFAAAIVLLALTACSAASPPSPSATSSDLPSPSVSSQGVEPSASPSVPSETNEHPAAGLALVQFPDSNSPASQVFVVDGDGNLQQATGHSGALPGASRPAWSPDRTQIAFAGPKVGNEINGVVAIVNADGSGERQVGEGANPRWSPEGGRLLFEDMDNGSGAPLGIWVVDLATGDLSRLVDEGSNGRWLPDGERISYHVSVLTPVEGTDGGFDISDAVHIKSLDGGEPQVLDGVADAVWSPDGSSVLIVNDDGISLAEADGSGATPLAGGWDPVWSPDGSRILLAYDMSQDALPILALVDRAGQEIWSGVVGSSPTWSPDGTRLAVEIAYPELMVQVIDAATGELLWEVDGMQPAW